MTTLSLIWIVFNQILQRIFGVALSTRWVDCDVPENGVDAFRDNKRNSDVVKDYPDAKGWMASLRPVAAGYGGGGIGTALEEKKSYA